MTLKQHIQFLNRLIRDDKVDRAVLGTVHATMAKRIFEEGKASDGSQIGTYSKGYKKVRREKNYPVSSKVILQATRQMVNDYSLIVLGKDEYGSGFKNNANGDKRVSVEKRYNKEIFQPTKQELDQIPRLYSEAIERYS